MRQPISFLFLRTLCCLGALGIGTWGAWADDDAHDPAKAVAGLDVAPGLDATLFASEPMLVSPSNIDVDSLGRVWVFEVVNYRSKKGTRPEGDRILVLEDTDGDGRADKQTVFYQGTDIDGGMGLCVLGNKVIVSASPNIFLFTDDNGDLKPDRKELLFGKTGEDQQHDHSAHAFIFGPDGRLYFNFGNAGAYVHTRDGRLVVDRAGHEVVDNGKPYRGGMVFRCGLDGGDFEVLAHNFRNNYEVAVDSFGTLWQSDNDDDGNRGVRINYIMEFGNYGYRDEMTGAGWKMPRTGMETDIAHQHWHQNDPGVVPNLLHTGAGSPTGIVVYEGRLLPKVFHDQVIHCDAGPNVVRAYPVEKSGAGFKAQIVDILKGTRDQWFRPSDVCVAPDGSLIVADWYDPGVGGHNVQDLGRGRLFRIAPPNIPYRIPKQDFSTPDGAARALESPNLATRYLAWTALSKMGSDAVASLEHVFEQSDNPRFRARALWLLGTIDSQADGILKRALADDNEDIRIAGLRLARRLKRPILPMVAQLADDASPQVRRECALALYYENSYEAAKVWARLAAQHDGRDRWYLEALGIGATGKWDACLKEWQRGSGANLQSPAVRDIVWRSRGEATPGLLAAIILDQTTPAEDLPRYLRAFDFLDRASKQNALQLLALGKTAGDKRTTFIVVEALKRLDAFALADKPEASTTLLAAIDALGKSADAALLIERFQVAARYDRLADFVADDPNGEAGIQAAVVLISRGAANDILSVLKDTNRERSQNMVLALGNTADERAVEILSPLLDGDDYPVELRRAAATALAKSKRGATLLIDKVQAKRLDMRLTPAAAAALNASPAKAIREKAQQLFPLPKAKDNRQLPPVSALVSRHGDVDKGRQVFTTTGTCIKCHVWKTLGMEVGPNLNEIGDKLSRQALYDSILYPSAGISHNYENYVVVLENGTTVNGIVTSRSDSEITIKNAEAVARTFPMSEIAEIVKQDISLMPADIHTLMSADDLVDLVEFLTTLRKGS